MTWYSKLHFKEQHIDLAPPLEIINKEEEYEVEEIRNLRKQEYKMQFLVHWREYGNKHDQWIVEMRLPHAKEASQDY